MSFFYFASLFYLQNSVIIDAISMRNSRWHAFVESPGIATCSGRIYEHVLSVCFSFAGQIKGSDGRARLESHDSWVYSQGHLQEFRFQEQTPFRARATGYSYKRSNFWDYTIFYSFKYPTLPNSSSQLL